MAQTVLLACDLSADNRAAFARAIKLAHASGSRLDILHVLDPYLPRQTLRDLEREVVDELERQLTDIREDYALPAPETLIQTVTGAPYAEIIREAHDRDATMIVLGTHRKRGQHALVGGTTLARVLSRAPCPVLTVSHSPEQAWQDVLVPVDFSLASRHTLRDVLTHFSEARLTLLHAWHLPGDEEMGSDSGYARWRERELAARRIRLEAEIDKLMEEVGDVPELELVLEQGEPGEVLIDYLRRQPPDLLALGHQDLALFGRHHPAPLIERLLADVHVDMMVCRAW
ncbi:universal stress protein [Chromohalobacter israelensis]|uniref:UspA n=1 Tax=Chromohalobacter israelensis (strain ATCC BAA-138 / DSM 3043 / CIP 106854 / NCIMB 13768 / 1H11) TaxID=290398 RepID=Q1QST0_CHRI1|nr:universal stress protein [Chromohalobacter salexigens]ABE60478.1 UspA [Chromohalobacter salexigens DSM 3043]